MDGASTTVVTSSVHSTPADSRIRLADRQRDEASVRETPSASLTNVTLLTSEDDVDPTLGAGAGLASGTQRGPNEEIGSVTRNGGVGRGGQPQGE